MNVSIIENDSNKVLATYKIHIAGLDYTPPDDEYFTAAWENAVEDELVKPGARKKHSFTLEK